MTTAVKSRTPANGASPPIARVARGSGIALWRQIADEIRRGIGQGLAGDDGRLPPEVALAQRFGVNRHTVRAAISGLVQEGILEAVQGRGTFVIPTRRMTYRIERRTRFSASLDGRTDQRRITMIEAATEPVSAAIAADLGIAADSPGIRVETLGIADAMPVSRATSWFDAERFSGIAGQIEMFGSVTAALNGFGIDDYYRRATRIEARHASDADRRFLDLAPGAIVIVASAVNVDMNGRITHVSRTRFAADRVDLVVDTSSLPITETGRRD